jgi:hypothetical protein
MLTAMRLNKKRTKKTTMATKKKTKTTKKKKASKPASCKFLAWLAI